ncbi:MAG: formate dehydrogenase accessory sulfurtransferase FdhD [Gemmatimonadaceae bacterium]|nr:formate dehydrogenase accessory sulfurtransferase FdhD [Gemmatimonadaceae bacterium]
MTIPEPPALPGAELRRVQAGDTGHAETWGIAVESPVQITINGNPWTVQLATPADLADLAIGLAVTERLIPDAGAVREVQVSTFLQDVTVDLRVDEARLDRSAMPVRAMPAGTACGLCGLESLAALHARQDRSRTESPQTGDSALIPDIGDSALDRAFAELPGLQPLNARTRSVHAAAWCAPDGAILLVREDVGRHNALDKLVGALAQSGRLSQPGFVVMSSRCSFELVQKASVTGARLLATVSAPTSMALQWAEALGLPLACRAGGNGVRRFVRFRRGDAGAP